MRIEGDRDQLMRAGDAAWLELRAVLDPADPALPPDFRERSERGRREPGLFDSDHT